jgi:hypothetical protein
MLISKILISQIIIHSSVAVHLFLGPVPLFGFVIFFTQTVELFGRVIYPSQGRYLHTRQHIYRINAHIYIHDLNGIRTHDPSVLSSEDSSYIRPLDHCDRPLQIITYS